MLVCPNCRGVLFERGCLSCEGCGSIFAKNDYGFTMFTDFHFDVSTTTEDYARTQESGANRFYAEYLKPHIVQEPCQRILDVGCGVGGVVTCLIEDGYDAYGIDLPALSKYWAKNGNDSKRFFGCDASKLPFANGVFDVVYSLGVIEHIGTKLGHYTLSSDYRKARQKYANEILRVTKPNGRILIACPNKTFPIDIQHEAHDALTPITLATRLRKYICEKTRINLHPTWGEYHLLSYSETKTLFYGYGKGHSFRPLPLRGYFGMSRLQSGFLKPLKHLAKFYVDNLPIFLRSSFLNPYMLVEIIK